MKNKSVNVDDNEMKPADDKLPKPVESTSPVTAWQNPFFGGGFFQFRCSYGEITSENGKSHVRFREQRFENGKISSQEFEGTAGPEVYEKAAEEMQDLAFKTVQTQFVLMTSMMSAFLPKSKRD